MAIYELSDLELDAVSAGGGGNVSYKYNIKQKLYNKQEAVAVSKGHGDAIAYNEAENTQSVSIS